MSKNIKHLLALLLITITIQSMYSFWVTPQVQLIQDIAAETNTILPRNFFIIIKDLEQKACIILFICKKMSNLVNILKKINLLRKSRPLFQLLERILNNTRGFFWF